jgi:excisionase family DNA binding protein
VINQITLISITLDELKNLIKEAVREELEAREQKEDEKMLSVSEVSTLFGVTKATVYNWTTEGKLSKYKVGGKVFWKYSEVMEAAKQLKKYK